MVEYILLLVVSVALVLGLAYQLFTPFRKFVETSMGSYTACLLETGEVPRLGGPTNITEDPSECGIQMGPKGTAPIFSGNSGKNTSSGGKGDRNSTPGSQDRGSGGSGGGSSGGSSGRGAYFNNRSRSGDGPGSDKGKQISIATLPASTGTFRASGESVWTVGPTGERRRVLGLDRLSAEERAEIEKTKTVKTLSVSAAEKTNSKKFIVKPPPTREPAKEKDDSFDFGNFLRILIIGIIILVLLIVFGSQAYKLTKSWEK